MKCIQNMCKELYLFPPGHYMRATRDGKVEFTRWFNPPWVVDPEAVPKTVPDLAVLRKKVVDAVVKRLMTDVPFGILLVSCPFCETEAD